MRNLFEGIEKDMFCGKEYTVAYPEEGDIVRINLHDRTFDRRLRNYFILRWPSIEHVHRNGYTTTDRLPLFILHCWNVNLGGDFGISSVCFAPERDIVVKPTIGDLFEFCDKARIGGFICDRNKKIVMDKHEYFLRYKLK